LSTATISAGQLTGRASSLITTLRAAYNESQQIKRENASRVTELGRLRKDKLHEIVALYLPNLSPETIGAVNRLTGFRAFEVKSPADDLVTRRDELSNRVAEIERDPLYVNRQKLTDPVAGDLTLEKERLTGEKGLLDQSVGRFEGADGFLDLINRGYDTPDYKQSKFSLQYYRDWKRGDEIEDTFKPVEEAEEPAARPSFNDLAYQYRQVKEAAETYRLDIERVEKEIASVERLVAEREEALKSLSTLPEDTLAESQKRLMEHVEHADRADLAERGRGREDLLSALKHLEGLEKKIEYLEALTRQYVDSDAEALLDRITGLEKKVQKYSRPKNRSARIPAAEADRWLKDPTPKVRERWGRYRTAHTRVYSFNRYDDYDFFSNYLWWDVMTDGELDGNFINEVSDYRAEHPETRGVYDAADLVGSDQSTVLGETDFS
jgi:hypothetical protein